MAKVSGFNNTYKGLSENEAWQRIYEFGKNLMPIKERDLQKKYNKIFNKKTKVIRDNMITKVITDKIVPGDVIIIEKGDTVSADSKVLEEISLEFERGFISEDGFEDEINEKIVYQGMKVKRGKAIIEAIRTGDSTYLGNVVKKIDKKYIRELNFEKTIQRYFNIIGVIGVILLIFGAIFSIVTGEGNIFYRLENAGYSGLLLFLSVFPIGSIFVLMLKMFDEKNLIKRSNLIIKKYSSLLKAHKTSVICIDDRFLKRNYEKYIQRFYSAGIMVAVISNKGEEAVKELAKKAGIFDDNVETISGSQLEKMNEDDFYHTICNTVIFYDVNNKQKSKIMEGFHYLNIKTLGLIDKLEDLPMIEYANVEICTHHGKKSLEYELSDAAIIGNELTSVYSFIKGSCIIKNYFNQYMKYYVMFQLPVVLSLLVALLAGLSFKTFYIQVLIYIMVIIPLLLLLINRDYSEKLLVELKKADKNFIISCIKFGFCGIILSLLGIGLYIFLSNFYVLDIIKISCVIIMLTFIDMFIVFMSRKLVNSDSGVSKNKKTLEKEKTNETKIIKKEEKINKKIVKDKPRKKRGANIEEMKDQLM